MRVTLDFDTQNRLRLLMAYFNLMHMFPGHPIRVRDSSRKHGYHLLVYGTKVTREQNLVLRMCLGEDQAHFRYDQETIEGRVHKPFQIAWTKKSSSQTVEEIDPLAEPWKLTKFVRKSRR